MNPLDRLEALERLNHLEVELLGVKRLNKDIRRQSECLMEEIDSVTRRLEVALAIKSHRCRSIPKVVSRSRASESAAVVQLSDWHVEETVDSRTINGRNEFSLQIANKRISACCENALKLIELSRHGTKIDTLVIALLGDFMTGYIHEELMEGNSLSPVETILWLKERMVPFLRRLIKESGCKRVIIPCTVGNHGRTTLKKRVATSTSNSYEWLLYHVLATEVPEAEWLIADGSHQYVNVFGMNIRCSHGDSFKYQGGIGGITIPVLKAIPKWNGIVKADLDIFGHWHAFMAHRQFVCNSSLIGFNAFALEIKAEFEPPSQTFFLVENHYGRTITTPIFLE